MQEAGLSRQSTEVTVGGGVDESGGVPNPCGWGTAEGWKDGLEGSLHCTIYGKRGPVLHEMC